MALKAKTKSARNGSDVLDVLFANWRSDSKGQKIMGCWIGGLVVASVWGIYIKTKIKNKNKQTLKITPKIPPSFLKNQENSMQSEEMKVSDFKERSVSLLSQMSDEEITPHGDFEENQQKDSFSTFRRILDIAIPSVLSSPILWSTLLSTSLIYKSSCTSLINDHIGDLGELLVCKRWKLLSDKTMDFAIIAVKTSFSIATTSLLSNLLTLSLNDNLFHFISKKYKVSEKNDNICHLYRCKQQMESMNHRVVDMNEWSKSYALCFVSFCKPIIDLSMYSNKLISRIGIYYFGQCMFYFVISSMWTRSVLPSYASLKSVLLKYESKYQQDNDRIIEYVEEVHYLKGSSTEIKLLEQSYDDLYNQTSSVYVYDFVYEFFQSYVVRYLGILASFISLLPMIKSEKTPTSFLLNKLNIFIINLLVT